MVFKLLNGLFRGLKKIKFARPITTPIARRIRHISDYFRKGNDGKRHIWKTFLSHRKAKAINLRRNVLKHPFRSTGRWIKNLIIGAAVGYVAKKALGSVFGGNSSGESVPNNAPQFDSSSVIQPSEVYSNGTPRSSRTNLSGGSNKSASKLSLKEKLAEAKADQVAAVKSVSQIHGSNIQVSNKLEQIYARNKPTDGKLDAIIELLNKNNELTNENLKISDSQRKLKEAEIRSKLTRSSELYNNLAKLQTQMNSANNDAISTIAESNENLSRSIIANQKNNFEKSSKEAKKSSLLKWMLFGGILLGINKLLGGFEGWKKVWGESVNWIGEKLESFGQWFSGLDESLEGIGNTIAGAGEYLQDNSGVEPSEEDLYNKFNEGVTDSDEDLMENSPESKMTDTQNEAKLATAVDTKSRLNADNQKAIEASKTKDAELKAAKDQLANDKKALKEAKVAQQSNLKNPNATPQSKGAHTKAVNKAQKAVDESKKLVTAKKSQAKYWKNQVPTALKGVGKFLGRALRIGAIADGVAKGAQLAGGSKANRVAGGITGGLMGFADMFALIPGMKGTFFDDAYTNSRVASGELGLPGLKLIGPSKDDPKKYVLGLYPLIHFDDQGQPIYDKDYKMNPIGYIQISEKDAYKFSYMWKNGFDDWNRVQLKTPRDIYRTAFSEVVAKHIGGDDGGINYKKVDKDWGLGNLLNQDWSDEERLVALNKRFGVKTKDIATPGSDLLNAAFSTVASPITAAFGDKSYLENLKESNVEDWKNVGNSIADGFWNNPFGKNSKAYANGTNRHPGGKAVVGDGGKSEVIITPDNKAYLTPNKPTAVNLPAGSKVIPEITALHDGEKVKAYANGTNNPSIVEVKTGPDLIQKSSNANRLSDRSQRIIYVNDWLTKNTNFTPEQIAGIIGVLLAESQLKPEIFNKMEAAKWTGKHAYKYGRGIAQWSLDRNKDFMKWYRDNYGKDGVYPNQTDMDTQLRFMLHEMNQRKAFMKHMINAKDPVTAADIMLRGFENGGYNKLASPQKLDEYAKVGSGNYAKLLKDRSKYSLEAFKVISGNDFDVSTIDPKLLAGATTPDKIDYSLANKSNNLGYDFSGVQHLAENGLASTYDSIFEDIRNNSLINSILGKTNFVANAEHTPVVDITKDEPEVPESIKRPEEPKSSSPIISPTWNGGSTTVNNTTNVYVHSNNAKLAEKA